MTPSSPWSTGARSRCLRPTETAIAPQLRVLLDRGAFGLRDIPGVCTVRELSEQELLADTELAAADPRLRSAANANTPEEWAELVAEG